MDNKKSIQRECDHTQTRTRARMTSQYSDINMGSLPASMISFANIKPMLKLSNDDLLFLFDEEVPDEGETDTITVTNPGENKLVTDKGNVKEGDRLAFGIKTSGCNKPPKVPKTSDPIDNFNVGQTNILVSDPSYNHRHLDLDENH